MALRWFITLIEQVELIFFFVLPHHELLWLKPAAKSWEMTSVVMKTETYCWCLITAWDECEFDSCKHYLWKCDSMSNQKTATDVCNELWSVSTASSSLLQFGFARLMVMWCHLLLWKCRQLDVGGSSGWLKHIVVHFRVSPERINVYFRLISEASHCEVTDCVSEDWYLRWFVLRVDAPLPVCCRLRPCFTDGRPFRVMRPVQSMFGLSTDRSWAAAPALAETGVIFLLAAWWQRCFVKAFYTPTVPPIKMCFTGSP